jgi:hypothetical protein
MEPNMNPDQEAVIRLEEQMKFIKDEQAAMKKDVKDILNYITELKGGIKLANAVWSVIGAIGLWLCQTLYTSFNK